MIQLSVVFIRMILSDFVIFIASTVMHSRAAVIGSPLVISAQALVIFDQ